MDRKQISTIMSHLFIGGLVKVNDIILYIDNEGNVKGINKFPKYDLTNYEKTNNKVLLDDYKVKSLLGFVDSNYIYEEINYNSLSINYLLRQLMHSASIKLM